MKRLIVFDLDGTLAESKSPLDAEMATLVGALLGVVKVAIISGGNWPQFEAQVLARLRSEDNLQNLSLLPTCGTRFYRYGSVWRSLYSEDFTDAEKEEIVTSLKSAIAMSGVQPEKLWGEPIEDRGSQITYSALGQSAPPEQKRKWDPGFAKRKRVKEILDRLLPGYSVLLGGTTSVDITRAGVDKAYGIAKLRDVLGIAIGEMVFVGDAVFQGGNDYPAKEAGVVCIQVRDPNETKRVVEAIIACLGR